MSTNKNAIRTGGGSTPENTYYGTTAPTLTSTYVAGDIWYVTPLGTVADSANATAQYRFDGTKWVKTPGGSGKTQNPELVPVRDFKTQAQLDTLASGTPKPNDGTSYIVTDGANKSNIFTWDEYANGGAGAFIQYIPSNEDVTTMTNPDLIDNTGKWSYDLATDTWIQISDSIELPTPTPQPVSNQNISLTREENIITQKSNGPVFIQNDYVLTYGASTVINSGDLTANNNLPRKISWNWFNLVSGSYAKSAQYSPKFVDAIQNATYMIALDHLGKVWAMGNQQVGTGMCTTPTGTTAVTTLPVYGLSPIGFFQANANIVISKIFTNGFSYNLTASQNMSAALAQDGKLYVSGANNWGQHGYGNTTAFTNWRLYPIENVKNVKISARGIFVHTNTNQLYYSGYKDAAWINSSTSVAVTTPLLISNDVLDFDFGNFQGQHLYIVRTNNTLWTAGNNANGQLGLGNTTTTTPLTQVTGFTNVKKIFANKVDGLNAVMLRTDGSIACVGNNRAGMLSFTGATAAANYTTFFTPSFSGQGTITDVIVGFQVVSLMTSNGSIWNAGQTQWRGLGIITNVWADNNKFQQVPLPEAVLGMRGFHEVSNNNEGVYVLTTNYGVIAWGSNTVTRINANSNEAYSPRIMTELYALNNGIARLNPPKLAADEVGSITGATESTVTDIVDGVNGQTVTFKVNYTGGVFGTLPITASVTGADITEVALLTNSVIITGASGTFDVQFTIDASDIPALVPPNTQAQDYVLTLNT